MEWFKFLVPLIGVFIGWLLTQKSKLWQDKKEDKRNLNKMLFYLLELRFYFSRKLKFITIINLLTKKLEAMNFRESIVGYMSQIKPELEEKFSKSIINRDRLNHLENNFDIIIDQIAQEYPALAFELKDAFNHINTSDEVNQYCEDVDNALDSSNVSFKGWFKPNYNTQMLELLENKIKIISKKVNSSTRIEVLQKLKEIKEKEKSEPIDADYIKNYMKFLDEKIPEKEKQCL